MSTPAIDHHYALIVADCGWIAIGIIWCIGRLSAKRIATAQPRHTKITYFSIFTLTMVMLFHPVFFTGEPVISHQPSTLAFGLILFLLGFILTIWSRMALATNWSGSVAIKEDHELIQCGPYRWVRHPMYTGLFMMVAGTAVISGTIDATIAFVVFVVIHLWKMGREEALLSAHFSASYPAYKIRTKALIPFAY